MSTTSGEATADLVVKTYPLNSRRLTAEIVNRIANGLGLPTNSSREELWQLVEGKLAEEYEPKNVQVDIIELEHGVTSIKLRDQSGVILDIPGDDEPEEEREPGREGDRSRRSSEGEADGAREELTSREALMAQLREARDRVCELRSELETVVETNRGVTEENMALVEEVSKYKVKLREEEEKYSALWRMSCEQLVGLDAALAAKEEELESIRAKEGELESLRSRLETLEGSEHAMAIHIGARTSEALGKGHFVTTGTRVSRVPVGEAVAPVSTLAAAPTGIPVAPRKGPLESHRVRKAGEGPESVPRVASDREPHVPSSIRRGKAPPVDSFNGESQEVLFEDWLPSLHRVAEWNGWSSSETLIQLAGHLRGRALQEWGLLSAGEKASRRSNHSNAQSSGSL